MSNVCVTKEECAAQHAAVLEKLESIEARLFVDNGHVSMQTRLARHEMVIHALLWVVSVVVGTTIAGAVSACLVLVKVLSKL